MQYFSTLLVDVKCFGSPGLLKRESGNNQMWNTVYCFSYWVINIVVFIALIFKLVAECVKWVFR